jgi:guanylate cyclase soluble subunit beta
VHHLFPQEIAMFGWINDCTEKLVISKFGVETWHAVKEKAGCTVKDGGFIRHERYSDESTVALVVAASEVLNISVDDVLEAFGVYFMEFTRAEGFEKLLNCQGSTLRTWLSNINALHDHLESAFPRGMIKPVFWCEDDEDVEGSIILHYYSKRGNLLVPIVIGLVKEVARFHFDVAINMVLLQKQDIEGAAFTSFRISAVDESEQWKITVREEWASGVPTFTKTDIPSGARCPFSGAITEDIPYGNEVAQTEIERNRDECQVSISGDKMKEIFPFHVCVDKDFVILQIGKALPNLLKVDTSDLVGKKISEVMEIIKPVHGIWEWHALRKLEDQTFFLQSCINKVALKGNMIKLSQDPYRVVFFLSPDVQNVAELTKTGLTLSDLPLHSFQRDTVFLGEHIVAEVKAAFKLDKLSKNLESEKNVSNNLLYSMLPRMVADDLRAGKVVEPELYPDVTMFFSDIVGFTTM